MRTPQRGETAAGERHSRRGAQRTETSREGADWSAPGRLRARLSYCLSRATRRRPAATQQEGQSDRDAVCATAEMPPQPPVASESSLAEWVLVVGSNGGERDASDPTINDGDGDGDDNDDDDDEDDHVAATNKINMQRAGDKEHVSIQRLSQECGASGERQESRLLTPISSTNCLSGAPANTLTRGCGEQASCRSSCEVDEPPERQRHSARKKVSPKRGLVWSLVQLFTLYELVRLLLCGGPSLHELLAGGRRSLVAPTSRRPQSPAPRRDGGELLIFARASELAHGARNAPPDEEPSRRRNSPTSDNLESQRHHHGRNHHGRRRASRAKAPPPANQFAGKNSELKNATTTSETWRFPRKRAALDSPVPPPPVPFLGGEDLEASSRPLVASKGGLIRGITQKLATGKFVDAFLGIPFARPPEGRFRFRHPVPAPPWEHELDAGRPPNSCYQLIDTYFGASFRPTNIWNANTPLSEDCLYLNVWTPFGVANVTRPGGQAAAPRPNASAAKQRPVLVWIFGGGFYSGTSTLAIYEGGVLASEEDVVVVSMNYRVSALGFLYFERPDAPGNAGLFDQLMALQWVNDNIHQFGGDPARVTIFGESAGAVSVALHLLSPLSRNLFDKAILQSGAATCPWGIMEGAEIKANGVQLAKQLNCPANDSDLDGILECLHKADPMELISQEVGQSKSVLNFPFVPVVDGSFLLEPPADSLQSRNFKQAPILLGSNNDEGNAFLVYMPEFSHCPTSASSSSSSSSSSPSTPTSTSSELPPPSEEEELGASARTGSLEAPPSVGAKMQSLDLLASGRQHQAANSSSQAAASGGHNHSQPEAAAADQDPNTRPCQLNDYPSLRREDFLNFLRDHQIPMAEHPIGEHAIVYEYSNWNSPFESVSNYDALDKIVGDYYFTCHVNEFAQHYSNAGNPVFMYYFRQRSTISAWPKWLGVLHGDEILFVFGEPLNQQQFNYTAKEVELSRRMMRYWANFARYGHPTNDTTTSSPGERWPDYSERRQYFELSADSSRLGRGPRSKQCAFWFKYLPDLLNSLDQAQCTPLNAAPTSDQKASRPQSSVRHQQHQHQQQHQQHQNHQQQQQQHQQQQHPQQQHQHHQQQQHYLNQNRFLQQHHHLEHHLAGPRFTQPYDLAACPPKQRGGLVNCLPASIVVSLSLLFFLALVCLIFLATRRRENGRQMFKLNLSSPRAAGRTEHAPDEASQSGPSRSG